MPAASLPKQKVFSDTSVRFAHLIVLLVASTIGMINYTIDMLLPSDRMRACFLAAGVNFENSSISQMVYALSLNAEAFNSCRARNQGQDPWWIGAGWAALLLVGTVVLVNVIPRWRTRGGRFISLAEVDREGGLRADLEELARQAGLNGVPRVVVDPFASSDGACVFGSSRSPVLRIHGGLLALRRKDPEHFRSVILHEFAHVHNRDVTITYAVVAMWRVFLVLVLIPFIGVQAYAIPVAADRLAWGENQLWRTSVHIATAAVMITLVYLARAEILRIREHHADLTANEWGADRKVWSMPETARSPRLPLGVERVFSTLLTHPSWKMRRAVLSDPTLLNRLQKLPLMLTGLAAVLVWHQASLTVNAAAATPLVANLASMLIPAVVLTLSLWRFITHGGVLRGRLPSGGYAGFWTGIGMVAAIPLVTNIATYGLPRHPELLVVVLLMVTVFGWWISQMIHLSVVAGRSGRQPWLVVVLASAAWIVLAAIWSLQNLLQLFVEGLAIDFEALRAALTAGMQSDPLSVGAHSLGMKVQAAWFVPQLLAYEPVLFMALTLLWTLPLLSIAAARPFSDRRGFSLSAAASGAAAGVAVAAVGWLYVPDLAGMPMARSILQSAVGFVFFLHWQAALSVLGAVLASLVATLRVRGHRLVHALVAGQVAILVSAACSLVVDVGVTWLPDAAVLSWVEVIGAIWPTFWLTFFPVALVAAVASVVTAFAVSLWFRILPKDSAGQWLGEKPHISRPKALARSSAITVTCGVALAFATWQSVQTGQNAGTEIVRSVSIANAVDKPSREVLRAQVIEWRNEGGDALHNRFGVALLQLDNTIEAISDDPGSLTRIPDICRQLTMVAADARSYFLFPDIDGQKLWEQLVAAAETNGGSCATAYEKKDSESLTQALHNLLGLIEPYLDFDHRIDTLTRQ